MGDQECRKIKMTYKNKYSGKIKFIDKTLEKLLFEIFSYSQMNKNENKWIKK